MLLTNHTSINHLQSTIVLQHLLQLLLFSSFLFVCFYFLLSISYRSLVEISDSSTTSTVIFDESGGYRFAPWSIGDVDLLCIDFRSSLFYASVVCVVVLFFVSVPVALLLRRWAMENSGSGNPNRDRDFGL